MNDETLHALLKSTDDRLGRTPRPVDAASTVAAIRQRRGRQVRIRITILSCAVAFFLGGLSIWSLNHGQYGGRPIADSSPELLRSTDLEPAQGRRLPDALQTADDIARLKAEIAALEAEAGRAERFVRLLQAAEARRDQLAAAATANDPVTYLSPQTLAELGVDRAAGITVISAESMDDQFGRADEAADAYRSVLTNFPDSRWASIARERLAQTMN